MVCLSFGVDLVGALGCVICFCSCSFFVLFLRCGSYILPALVLLVALLACLFDSGFCDGTPGTAEKG